MIALDLRSLSIRLECDYSSHREKMKLLRLQHNCCELPNLDYLLLTSDFYQVNLAEVLQEATFRHYPHSLCLVHVDWTDLASTLRESNTRNLESTYSNGFINFSSDLSASSLV
jgi:hypothetical protein